MRKLIQGKVTPSDKAQYRKATDVQPRGHKSLVLLKACVSRTVVDASHAVPCLAHSAESWGSHKVFTAKSTTRPALSSPQIMRSAGFGAHCLTDTGPLWSETYIADIASGTLGRSQQVQAHLHRLALWVGEPVVRAPYIKPEQ